MLNYTGVLLQSTAKIRLNVAHAPFSRKNIFMNSELAKALSSKVDSNLNIELTGYKTNNLANAYNAKGAYVAPNDLGSTESLKANYVGDHFDNSNMTKQLSCWHWWEEYYYPKVIRESYPVYVQERSLDKGKQAFELVKMMKDKGFVKLEKAYDFIELMDALIKHL